MTAIWHETLSMRASFDRFFGDQPVVLIQAQPAARLAVNACELARRGVQIITVGGTDAVLPAVLPSIEPPWGPLEATVALQHLAREMASALGHDVDRPRNLAKSVTVE